MEILSKTNRRTYWAAETDPEDIVDLCRDKISEYSDVITQNMMLRRIMRSWRYYHGLFFQGALEGDMAIKALGSQGELAGIAINDFRSLIQQIVAMITKNRVSVDLLAKSSDIAALTQARLGKLVIEDQAQRAEAFFDTAVEHALIFNAGFVSTTWDKRGGEEYDAPPPDYQIQMTGDVEYANPSIFDVVYDPTSQCWSENQWVLIRKRRNKYDLAALYPEMEEKLFMADEKEERGTKDSSLFYFNTAGDTVSDKVDVWCFYHMPSQALPEGRYLEFFQRELLPEYENSPMPYKQLPLDRVVSGELLLTCFGYSPALDMQGPQEALNSEFSTLLSNHKAWKSVV